MAQPPAPPPPDNASGQRAAQPGPDRRATAAWLRYAGLGLTMLGYILLPTAAGYWVDTRTSSPQPWGVLVGALLGCAAAVAFAVRFVLRDSGRRKR